MITIPNFAPTAWRRRGRGSAAYDWYGKTGWHPSAPYPAEALITSHVAVYQPHWGAGTVFARADAASYANSKINLANPGTYDAVDGAAYPTWSTTGWAGNGSSQYLICAAVPANGWSGFVEYSGVTKTYCYAFGEYAANKAFAVRPTNYGNHMYLNGGLLDVSGTVASGNLGVAGQQGYKNGAADGAALSAWSGTNTYPIYIFNTTTTGAGPGAQWMDGIIKAMFVLNSIPSANQIANLAWGMGIISGRLTI